MTLTASETVTAELAVRGPYDLAEVALMGFGHRDERRFDGVMRMAFCLDDSYERQVGVAARQSGDRIGLEIQAEGQPLSAAEIDAVKVQVARVISVDADGEAFDRLCNADPALAPIHGVAPGFRPANFYSPYEAAVWSILSARRGRAQGITVRKRLAEADGASFDVAGVPTAAVPTPSQLLRVQSVPGLPADRIPRLHAIAEAAQAGRLSTARLRALPPEEVKVELQKLPGIGPFYSALIVIRSLGHTDALSLEESHAREAVRELYGIDHPLTDAELTDIAERWRPWRTWVMVMLRALGGRRPS